MTSDFHTKHDPYTRPANYCPNCDAPDLLAFQSGLSRLGAEYYTRLTTPREEPQNARLDAIEAEIDDLIEMMPPEWQPHCLIHYWGFLLMTGLRSR